MYNIPSSVINGNGDILTHDSYSSFTVTHPILINEGETLYANHAATGTVYSAIYGIDGRVIETYNDKKAISYVDGAAFVQFTFFATDLNVLQVEVGESETEYTPNTLHCCDGIHPHSDMSGLSNIVLARSIAGWIKANIWGD